jgi:hypothetical protein
VAGGWQERDAAGLGTSAAASLTLGENGAARRSNRQRAALPLVTILVTGVAGLRKPALGERLAARLCLPLEAHDTPATLAGVIGVRLGEEIFFVSNPGLGLWALEKNATC